MEGKESPSPREALPPEISAAYEDPDYYMKYMGGAKEYAGKTLQRKYLRAISLAQSRRDPIQRILDVGCGRGEIVNHFCLLGIQAIGVEYSKAACSIAHALLSKNPKGHLGKIINIRDCTLDFPPDHFDVAFMLDVVEHLYESQLDSYYAQIRRV